MNTYIHTDIERERERERESEREREREGEREREREREKEYTWCIACKNIFIPTFIITRTNTDNRDKAWSDEFVCVVCVCVLIMCMCACVYARAKRVQMCTSSVDTHQATKVDSDHYRVCRFFPT